MQSAKYYWAVFVVLCFGTSVIFADQPLTQPQGVKATEAPVFIELLPAPEFVPVNYLRTSDIPKMTIEKALALTKRHASYFLGPIDAAILHVRVEGELRDVFVFSDAGQSRLMLWQCTQPDNTGHRVIEAVTAYYGDEHLPLSTVSGIETNARNREFNPAQDFIYVADRGNGRILELTYAPNKSGGELSINRIIGEGVLHWPVDLAISAYGDANINTADLYVVDVGTYNQDGQLCRFNLRSGNLEASWKKAMTIKGDEFMSYGKPIAVACYPDSVMGVSQIYIVDADNNCLLLLKSDTDKEPYVFAAQTLEFGDSLDFAPGGVSLDDYGRVYAVNELANKIQLFGPEMWPQYGSYGKFGVDEPGQFNYPCNIIIDTYYSQAEAILLEYYYRLSGIQSFLINGAASAIKPALGFDNPGLLKHAIGQAPILANAFKLGDAYPNPFNSKCIISFTTLQQANIKIEIFNILGQKIATAFDGSASAGEHQVNFDGSAFGSGIYLYRMTGEGYSKTKKVVMIK